MARSMGCGRQHGHPYEGIAALVVDQKLVLPSRFPAFNKHHPWRQAQRVLRFAFFPVKLWRQNRFVASVQHLQGIAAVDNGKPKVVLHIPVRLRARIVSTSCAVVQKQIIAIGQLQRLRARLPVLVGSAQEGRRECRSGATDRCVADRSNSHEHRVKEAGARRQETRVQKVVFAEIECFREADRRIAPIQIVRGRVADEESPGLAPIDSGE